MPDWFVAAWHGIWAFGAVAEFGLLVAAFGLVAWALARPEKPIEVKGEEQRIQLPPR